MIDLNELKELKEMTGTCAHCGQTKIVQAATQDEADHKAAIDCTCPGGDVERRKKQVKEQLDELIGYLAPDNGWEPAKEETFDAIREIADQIAEEKITSCAIRIDDTNLKISRNKGKITIERSKTIKQGGSIEK